MTNKKNSTDDFKFWTMATFMVVMFAFGIWVGCTIQSAVFDAKAIKYYSDHEIPTPGPTATPIPEFKYSGEFATFEHSLNAYHLESDNGKIGEFTTGCIEINNLYGSNAMSANEPTAYNGRIRIFGGSNNVTNDHVKGPYIEIHDEFGNELLITAKGIIKHPAKHSPKKTDD